MEVDRAMAKKIGIIGGIGWPGTVCYYQELCRRARGNGTPGSPAMSIESLDMAATLAARGDGNNDHSWHAFDKIFTDALTRLATAECDLAAIASVTPHARLASISNSASLPIVSIVDAVEAELKTAKPEAVLVLGTSVTMQGKVFDSVFENCGCSRIVTTTSQVAAFTELLEKYFYQSRGAEGRGELFDYIQPLIGDLSSTLVLLACTDLAPAFPEINDTAIFDAGGFRFLDSTGAHVTAILEAATISDANS